VGGGGGGSVSTVASPDNSIVVTNPTGPTVDVAGVLPSGDTAGYAVNRTTYANPVTGSGDIATAVFPTDTVALALAITGDSHPRWLLLSDATDGLYLGHGTNDPYTTGPAIFTDGTAALIIETQSAAQLTVQSKGGASFIDNSSSLGGLIIEEQGSAPLLIESNSGGMSLIVHNAGGILISETTSGGIIIHASGTTGQLNLAGTIGIVCNNVFFPVQATTVGAPTYVKGGMYFDTTLNKLRIGGASGWETVSST
jgi:hypothetical protein